jgi:hypothetical protein
MLNCGTGNIIRLASTTFSNNIAASFVMGVTSALTLARTLIRNTVTVNKDNTVCAGKCKGNSAAINPLTPNDL